MTEPTASAEGKTDEQAIRERVRQLTSQMLSGGSLDTEGVKEVVRAMSGGGPSKPPFENAKAREAFTESLRLMDAALQASSQAAHSALQSLIARGKDVGDNDLKLAFAALQTLQSDYVAVTNKIAEATTGNLNRELSDLALHAQRVGADVNVRFAQMLSEFANRINAFRPDAMPGFDSMRQYGANMTLVTSALLGGFADALRQQAQSRKAP